MREGFEGELRVCGLLGWGWGIGELGNWGTGGKGEGRGVRFEGELGVGGVGMMVGE